MDGPKGKKELPKGIYKRGGVYWIRYAGLDGKIVFESAKQGERAGTKLKDAEDLLHERKADVARGKQPEVRKKIPNITFKEFSVDYLKWAERQKAFHRKHDLVLQLVEVFGAYPLRYLNTRLLEQYQTERLQMGNKSATINRHLATIKHMFTKAAEWELVEEEVLKRIRRVKLLPENNRRLRYLSGEECQGLINACGSHLRPLVITALNTGMRRGELFRLKWENVDFTHGFILLDTSKNGERREIPINEPLRNALQTLVRRLDVPYVFYNPDTGKPFKDIKTGFKNACRRGKINDFRFHDLRHTFASHLVMRGIDLTTVKELLGHKTLNMTLRYSHLAPSHMSKAVDVLADALNQTNYTITIQSKG